MNISEAAKNIAKDRGIKGITENQMIKRFNELGDIAKRNPSISGQEYLRRLSDQDLCVFFAGKTYAYGRAFDKSWENGLLHLKTDKQREKMVISFSGKSHDLLGRWDAN